VCAIQRSQATNRAIDTATAAMAIISVRSRNRGGGIGVLSQRLAALAFWIVVAISGTGDAYLGGVVRAGKRSVDGDALRICRSHDGWSGSIGALYRGLDEKHVIE
jgi:hypothetical protein